MQMAAKHNSVKQAGLSSLDITIAKIEMTLRTTTQTKTHHNSLLNDGSDKQGINKKQNHLI